MNELEFDLDQLKAYWAETEQKYEKKPVQQLQQLLKGKEQSLVKIISQRIVLEIILMAVLAVGLLIGTYLIGSPFQHLERIGILAWGIFTIALYGRVLWFVKQPVDENLSVKSQLIFVIERIREFLSVHSLMSTWVLPIWISCGMLYGLFLGLIRMNASFPDIPPLGWGVILAVLISYLWISRIISRKYIHKLYRVPLEDLEANLKELED